ncbi:hypothetical protein OS176_11300 [Xanthomonadaceae bacterium XH05]|nr:hypothetical protein [Xanthomonadaceae bacterium XH05]
MRPLPLLAGAVLALGLSFGGVAQAHGSDVRVFVSFGDVMFSAGRPYHRHHHYPLRVVHAAHGPQYYYVAPPPRPHYPHYRHHHPTPVYGHHQGRSHRHHPAPPPPRPGYHRHRPGY